MGNRFYRKNQGIITVFVVMIMVPVVVITGLMVDIARIKLFTSQVAMSSDFYGEAILSDYDNVLKELYGLFSVTQDEDALEALETYKTYMTYSFNPGADGEIQSGSMFYQDAEVEFSYDPIKISSLSNEDVFLTQVADYMEFRVIPQVLGEAGTLEGGVFEMLDGFEKMQPDNEAVGATKKLGDSSGKLTKAFKEFYDILNEIKQYEDYLADLKERADAYQKKLNEICKSSEYGDYAYYREQYAKKDEENEIKKAFAKQERINNAGPDSTEELTDGEQALIDKYSGYDAEEYRKSIETEMNEKSEAARKWDSDPVDFDNIDKKITDLGISAEGVEEKMIQLKADLADLRAKLNNGCSDEVKTGIEADIEGLEKLASAEGKFRKTANNETTKNTGKNAANKEKLTSVLNTLDGIKGELAAGTRKQNDTSAITNAKVDFTWAKVLYEVSEGTGDDNLYLYLKKLFTDRGEKSKLADQKQDAAADVQKNAVAEMDKEEDEEKKLELRNISDEVQKELDAPCMAEGEGADSRSFTEYFDDGFAFQSLETSLARLFDKFLLTEYDFGMFSSRVSGKEKKEGNGEKDKEDSEEEDKEDSEEEKKGDSEEENKEDSGKVEDKSISGITMSPAVNYLYGAELEYLFGGKQESAKNLAATRNTICGVRMTMNFISTYSIKELNEAINAVAEAASAATAATGVGAALAPAVRVAVSLALRAGIAAMESAEDWKSLKNREKVLLYKNNINDLSCIDKIKGLLQTDDNQDKLDAIKKTGSGSTGLKLSYEDYLHVLLFLFVTPSDLVGRTSNLVTLNVNQARKQDDKDGELSAPLDFKMSETVTAVKTTCKARLDMVVVPQNFMELFLQGDETQKAIEGLDDGYVYYTMIRGY